MNHRDRDQPVHDSARRDDRRSEPGFQQEHGRAAPATHAARPSRDGVDRGYGYTEGQGGTVYRQAPDARGFGPAGYAPRESEQEFGSTFDVRNSAPSYAQRYGTGSGARSYGNSTGAHGAGNRGRGPKGYVRSDARIEEDLNERLTDDDELDASGISVSVAKGVATLEGEVHERWMKHRAEDIADRCGGIKDVENRIRIRRAD